MGSLEIQSSSTETLHDQTESNIYARFKLKTHRAVLCSCAIRQSMIWYDQSMRLQNTSYFEHTKSWIVVLHKNNLNSPQKS